MYIVHNTLALLRSVYTQYTANNPPFFFHKTRLQRIVLSNLIKKLDYNVSFFIFTNVRLSIKICVHFLCSSSSSPYFKLQTSTVLVHHQTSSSSPLKLRFINVTYSSFFKVVLHLHLQTIEKHCSVNSSSSSWFINPRN